MADPPSIPGYRIVRVLGHGGMATVHLAVQESLGREVALKLLAPELAQDPVASERFMREARTAARLAHRNIVGVHDVGCHEGQPYLSMEYLPGGTLGGEALPPIRALQAVRDIALALDHAHAKGVVHRDVKPENILLRDDTTYALSDFGIARSASDGVRMTAPGMAVGTPQYMSPEQVQGLEVDGRSDIYSLGVVLYQLLTGQPPYQGTDGWNIGMQHISARCPHLPAALGRFQPLVEAMLAKDPQDRPQSGAEVAQQVEALMTGATPVATRLLGTPVPPARSRQARLLIPALAVAAVAAVGAWILWPERPDPARPQAQAPPASAPVVEPVAPAMPARSIAILPLVNLSDNPGNEYFSDGLAETLLDMLARAPDLTVIARTSSFAFKGRSMDVRKIGEALGATHLVEGSVQQSGQRLRINVQLIRASDGARLWSQRYDRQLSDVFAVQDDVASEIAKAMQLVLPGAEGGLRTGGTASVEAYQEYLRGIALLPLRKAEDLRAALQHFDRAIAIDPGYAIAYAEAANTLGLLSRIAEPSAEDIDRRERMVQQALRLDPTLGEAYIARAAVLGARDVEAAERDFKKGLALAPGYSTGYLWYGQFLASRLGRPADAVPMIRRAIAADPLQPNLRLHLGGLLMAIGKVAEAEVIGEELSRSNPDFGPGYGLRSLVHRGQGDLAGELRMLDRWIEIDAESILPYQSRCQALLMAGAHEAAIASARDAARRAKAPRVLAQVQAESMLLRGDATGVAQAIEALGDGGHRGLIADLQRLSGRPAEAVKILRQTQPEWFRNPITSPNLDYEYGPVEVAFALLATGDQEQARRALDFALPALRKRAPGSGFRGGRAWAETMSLALLGRMDEACSAMKAATDTGFYQAYEWLRAEPALADFRAQPCFEPLYAQAKASAARQVDRARKAGLL